MATYVGVGKSESHNAEEAGRAATRQALGTLEAHGGRCDILFVFATSGYDQSELLNAIMQESGSQTPLTGCSGEGVITQGGSDERSHAVGVMAIASDQVHFRPLHVQSVSKDVAACARQLAKEALAQPDGPWKMLLLFPDGLTANCCELVDTLDAELDRRLLVAGGAAGSIFNARVTYQYHAGQVYQDSVSAVLIGGALSPEVTVSHGCEPVGLERTVTKAHGTYVEEIDGKPAFQVFKEYLDGDPDDLLAVDILHLCIGEKLPAEHARGYGEYIIRTPMFLNKENGALFFPGPFKQGSQVQMTRRDPERIRRSVEEASRAIVSDHNGARPLLVLQFDCAGRGQAIFGERATEMAVEPIQQALGKNIPWLGFHTFGEIAPLGGKTYYHNYTVVLCALYDAEEAQARLGRKA